MKRSHAANAIFRKAAWMTATCSIAGIVRITTKRRSARVRKRKRSYYDLHSFLANYEVLRSFAGPQINLYKYVIRLNMGRPPGLPKRHCQSGYYTQETRPMGQGSSGIRTFLMENGGADSKPTRVHFS